MPRGRGVENHNVESERLNLLQHLGEALCSRTSVSGVALGESSRDAVVAAGCRLGRCAYHSLVDTWDGGGDVRQQALLRSVPAVRVDVVLWRRVHFQRVQVAAQRNGAGWLSNYSRAPSDQQRVGRRPEAIHERRVATELLLEGVTVEAVSATQPRMAQASASRRTAWEEARYRAART